MYKRMEYPKRSSDKFFYGNLVTRISLGAARRRNNEKERGRTEAE